MIWLYRGKEHCMESELVSLFIVVLCAFLCPILAALLPNKVIPETVFLLVAGMIIGPNVSGIVQADVSVNLLSDLGLGFLFLLAGYEIDVSELKGKGGMHGLRTWVITFLVALVVTIPVGIWRDNIPGGLAVGIMMTTTAFGTLVPILKERGLEGTPVGRGVVEYGVWGELCPIVAMAVLLGSRATWVTVLLLVVFAAIAVGSVFLSKAMSKSGSKFERFMRKNSETNAQSSVRFVMVLLVGLVALSSVFNLDIVLGAFAAGFALRAIIPKGDSSLEHKLNGTAYGFFVPLFFIVSGMKVDPAGVVAEPVMFAVFLVSLLVVRALPIFVSTCLRKDMKAESGREKVSIALYCTTALPLIVAICSVAMSSGALSDTAGSTFIAAGGITVLIMPLLASIALHTVDAEMSTAVREIAKHPKNARVILSEHRKLERDRSKQNRHVLTKQDAHHSVRRS